MLRLTAKQLENATACASAVEEFRRLFGEEAELTEENVDKAMQAGMADQAGFLALSFLTVDGQLRWERETATVDHADPARTCPRCKRGYMKFIELYEKAEYKR